MARSLSSVAALTRRLTKLLNVWPTFRRRVSSCAVEAQRARSFGANLCIGWAEQASELSCGYNVEFYYRAESAAGLTDCTARTARWFHLLAYEDAFRAGSKSNWGTRSGSPCLKTTSRQTRRRRRSRASQTRCGHRVRDSPRRRRKADGPDRDGCHGRSECILRDIVASTKRIQTAQD